MPRGGNGKGITWTDTNNTKLFLAILRTHDIKVDYQKVAQEFGDGATSNGLSQQVNKLKRKNKEFESSSPLNASTGAAATNGTTTPTPVKKRRTKVAIKKEPVAIAENVSEPEIKNKDKNDLFATPTPTLTPMKIFDGGRLSVDTKKEATPLVSPRPMKKMSYSELVDPFQGEEGPNENGEGASFAGRHDESEDSTISEYKAESI
ncbi:MAG: hypothetical protein M1829_001231 [Trizodia sp. TS-e1964]|nr:MAG: hypothetical protein M1829_001231 [Trizodia sp. TS-e1964]